MTRDPIGRLHVLTHDSATERDPVDLARRAAAAGADVIQLREKTERSIEERLRVARALVAIARGHGARLIVNDRVDVALAAAADGVHLGPTDLDAAIARDRLGLAALIGRTANSLTEAIEAARLPVDYLGVGPVFPTRSKTAPAAVLGLAGLARIVRSIELPVIAIGGIEASRVAEVLDTGAHGVAVLSAIADADDPDAATARFREAIDGWLARSDDHGTRAAIARR